MGRGKRHHARVSAPTLLGLSPAATFEELCQAHSELAKRFNFTKVVMGKTSVA